MLAPVITVVPVWKTTEHSAELASSVWKVQCVAPLGESVTNTPISRIVSARGPHRARTTICSEKCTLQAARNSRASTARPQSSFVAFLITPPSKRRIWSLDTGTESAPPAPSKLMIFRHAVASCCVFWL